MAKKALRVLQVTTDSGSMREVEDNERRLGVLAEALAIAEKKRCPVVQVPAGFLAVARGGDPEAAVEALLRARVAPLARKKRIAIVGGVDVAHRGEKHAALPYYGFVIDDGGTLYGPWKQQSNTGDQSDRGTPATEANAVKIHERLVPIGGRTGTLLVCGEMHNKWTRQGLAECSPDVVFVSGHDGYTRVTRSVRSVVLHGGAPTLHVQHLSGPASGAFHMVDQLAEHVSDAGKVVRDPSGRWWRYTLRVLRG